MNFTMPMYQDSNWSNSGDTLVVFFDKDCGRCLPSIKGREVFGPKENKGVLALHINDFGLLEKGADLCAAL